MNPLASLANRRRRLALSPCRGRAVLWASWACPLNPLASLANRRRRLALSPCRGRANIVECEDYIKLITSYLLPFTFWLRNLLFAICISYLPKAMNPLARLANRRRRPALSPCRGRAVLWASWACPLNPLATSSARADGRPSPPTWGVRR